jgi:ABC-2 type transport system permease protein
MTWVFFFVMLLLVIYGNTESVAGWGRGEAFILSASCFLMTALHNGMFMSLHEIPEAVRKGTLDYVLTKPVDSQFWVSCRRFNFDRIGSLTVGIVMVGLGVAQSGLHPSPEQWLAYLLGVASSIAIFYGLNLMMMTLGVWLVRVDNLWVLSETLLDVARYPLDIFPLPVQRFFTYALPMAFLATIPARQLAMGLDAQMAGLAAVWGLVFLLAARAFWRFATRNYTSASS